MTISMAMCRLTQPIINISSVTPKINITSLPRQQQKEKVVLVMGATGAGKSKLSIDLATLFQAEIINSDKMQAYKGLDIVTNKLTPQEQKNIPHHILGTQNPSSEFTAANFRDAALTSVAEIRSRGNLPIIVGGSNSFIEALVDDDDYKFRSKYEFCCLWIDVSLPILCDYVSERVDEMVRRGMVEELREFYGGARGGHARVEDWEFSRGIGKAIGVAEFGRVFRGEGRVEEAVREMKENTARLAAKQRGRIGDLRSVKRWRMERVDATRVFKRREEGAAREAVEEE